jgi:3-dehydrosphinganine reductase
VTDAGAARAPAFVTGGSSGIGLELARQLARRGMPVALLSRDTKKLSNALHAIRRDVPDADIRLYPVDVSNRAACLDAVQQATRDLGAPEWAVVCAGIAEPGEFLTQSLDAFEAQMSVNYMGALYFAHAAARAMTGGGKLVFISSGAAFFGIYGYSAYSPTKFAMRGLAEVLRVELAPRNIAVTLAYPPDTDTPMLATENRLKPEITRKISDSGGLWSAADVARAILRGADKERFAVAPGFQMTALLWLHSLLAPALRLWQGRIVKRSGR